MNFFIEILILISFIALKIYQSTRVPEGLKNVPTLSFLDLLNIIITKAGPDKRWEDSRKILEKEGIGKLWFAGKWALMVTDLELAKDIFTKPDLYHKLSFVESYPRSLFARYYGTNLVFSNGDVWKRYRHIIKPAFRDLPIHTFVESAMKLLEVMEKVDNEPIETKSLMHRVTLDALGKASFGFDFNYLENPNNEYVTAYNEVVKEIGNSLYFIIPFLDYLPRTKTHKNMEKLNNLYDEIIENKLKLMKTGVLDEKVKNNSADLLEYMIYASNDPENPTLTNEELRYNVITFMFAGHETTAIALTTTLYLLASHKDVQKKVRDELLHILGDDLTPNMGQQKELKYMNMVIKENLRLYPPVPRLPGRCTSQEIKFRNHIIPAKTSISLFIYGIHHSPKIWEDPENFIPERFENEHNDHYAWLSFGGGSRSCIGNNFSLIEQRVILCSLLRKYEVSLPADSIHRDKLQLGAEISGAIGIRSIPLIFKRRTE